MKLLHRAPPGCLSLITSIKYSFKSIKPVSRCPDMKRQESLSAQQVDECDSEEKKQNVARESTGR